MLVASLKIGFLAGNSWSNGRGKPIRALLRVTVGHFAVFLEVFWDSKPSFLMYVLPKSYPLLCLLKEAVVFAYTMDRAEELSRGTVAADRVLH